MSSTKYLRKRTYYLSNHSNMMKNEGKHEDNIGRFWSNR